MIVHLSMSSRNKKTGPIPVSTTEPKSCPKSCPLLGQGCYASAGPLALHWRKVGQGRGMGWDDFCQSIDSLPVGTVWRHNQAGDLPHKLGRIDGDKLMQLALANKNKHGFTYTHHRVSFNTDCQRHNAAEIFLANRLGFTVNLSANDPAHADTLLALKIAPVVTVLPMEDAPNETPNGARIVRCPAEYKDTDCARCRLCAKSDRYYVIGFTAHGTQKKAADKVARGEK